MNYTLSYQQNILKRAEQILLPNIEVNNISCKEEAQMYVDEYSDTINCTSYAAAADSIMVIQQGEQHGRRRRHWWNDDCRLTKNRHRFWFHIWLSCGRPGVGPVFDSFKLAKRSFIKSCTSAYNDSLNRNFAQCDKLFKQKRMKYFWNTIRRSKITVNSDLNNISSS